MADESPKREEEFFNPDGTPTNHAWRVWSDHFQRSFTRTQSYTALGQTFTYISARQVMDRLDRVVGMGNWMSHFMPLDKASGAVECTITIYNVAKSDVGYPNSQGDRQEKEALKSAYSDALKRAAVQWGIGRYLYRDGE